MTSVLQSPPKRLAMLSGVAAGIGLIGGGAAFILIRSIAMLMNLALFHRTGWQFPPIAEVPRGPGLVAVAVLGGLIVAAMALWSPEIRGHGLPEAREAVLAEESRIHPRAALAKPLSAVIAIGTGAPFGAEGPIIVTGGALGSLIGQLVPTSPSERKILLGCGAAAGMAATFGAPLAAVILAIELLVFEYSARALVPLVVASSFAAGVHAITLGSGPLFHVPSQDYAGLDRLPLYVVLGLACGLFAVVITRCLHLLQDGFGHLPVRPFWHPVIGALGYALIGLVAPRSLGVGYDVIDDVLASRLALGTVALVGGAKLLSWWVGIASGSSGGTLAPLLLVSGCFGSLLGAGAQHLFPGLQIAPGAFALVAMAATFGAAAGATFTSIVFLFELTRDYNIILPLMLAAVLAQLVASTLHGNTLMTEKLTRRGLHVEADYAVDVLAGRTVGDIMSPDPVVIPAAATTAEARKQLARSAYDVHPVVDDAGHCVGSLSRDDLERRDTSPGNSAAAARTEAFCVAPETPILDGIRMMLDHGVDQLMVTTDDDLVGIVTRTDVLDAQVHHLGNEERQPRVRFFTGARRRRAGRHAPTEGAPMRTHLVIANKTLGGAELTRVLADRCQQGPASFHVVVPASRHPGVLDRVIDAYAGEPGDDELREARSVAADHLARQLENIRALGTVADGEVGDPNPLTATQHVLEERTFDEIILSTLPAGASRWLGMDLPDQLQRTVGRPITHVIGQGAGRPGIGPDPPDQPGPDVPISSRVDPEGDR